MLKKALMVFVPVAAVFGLCLFFGLYTRNLGFFSNGVPVNSATVVRQVQSLSQLVTVKYVLEKVIDLKDTKWWPGGENRVLLVAHGVVKAGINLDNIQVSDVAISGKKIILTLPRPSITDVYLDDRQTQVLERTTGILRVFDKDLEQTARKEAEEDLRTAARESGILKDAEDRAKAQLTTFFYQLGFTEVEFDSRKT